MSNVCICFPPIKISRVQQSKSFLKFRVIIQRILQRSPKKRPTLEEILESDFLNESAQSDSIEITSDSSKEDENHKTKKNDIKSFKRNNFINEKVPKFKHTTHDNKSSTNKCIKVKRKYSNAGLKDFKEFDKPETSRELTKPHPVFKSKKASLKNFNREDRRKPSTEEETQDESIAGRRRTTFSKNLKKPKVRKFSSPGDIDSANSSQNQNFFKRLASKEFLKKEPREPSLNTSKADSELELVAKTKIFNKFLKKEPRADNRRPSNIRNSSSIQKSLNTQTSIDQEIKTPTTSRRAKPELNKCTSNLSLRLKKEEMRKKEGLISPIRSQKKNFFKKILSENSKEKSSSYKKQFGRLNSLQGNPSDFDSRRDRVTGRNNDNKRGDSISNKLDKIIDLQLKNKKNDLNSQEKVKKNLKFNNLSLRERRRATSCAQIITNKFDPEVFSGPEFDPDDYVKKWIDHSQKYGLVYIMHSGTMGILFNDSTKIIFKLRSE